MDNVRHVCNKIHMQRLTSYVVVAKWNQFEIMGISIFVVKFIKLYRRYMKLRILIWERKEPISPGGSKSSSLISKLLWWALVIEIYQQWLIEVFRGPREEVFEGTLAGMKGSCQGKISSKAVSLVPILSTCRRDISKMDSMKSLIECFMKVKEYLAFV